MVSHFKDHPAIIGFQVDSETHPNSSNSRSMNADFVNYLKRRFGATEKPNKLRGFTNWGSWSMTGTSSPGGSGY